MNYKKCREFLIRIYYIHIVPKANVIQNSIYIQPGYVLGISIKSQKAENLAIKRKNQF